MNRPVVLILGPSREAMSGVTTHLNGLLGSRLGTRFRLVHFQVGSEGRREGLAARLLRLVASPFVLAAAILRWDARVVHVNTSLNAKAYWRDLVYVLVARLCGARVLYQVHGGELQRFTESRFFSGFVRRAARWPDVLVVLSRQELEAFRRLAPGRAMETVPNGIDCEPYRRYSRPAPEPEAALRLIYVGRLAPAKGLLETVEAVRLAKSRGIAVRFVIAGAGPEEAGLRQYVRDAGLARDVAFVGPAYEDHKARLLAQADVFVLASYSEGLPYSLLEAMAAGVVPIATPVGGIPDAVKSGEHGLLVEPRDAEAIAEAIAALAADRAQLARMSATCRKRIAAAYSIERVAKDFSELYWGLCAVRTPRMAR